MIKNFSKKYLIWSHFCLLMLLVSSINAYAHKPSDSYLWMTVQQNKVIGQWDIALRDLDCAIGLDTNDSHTITWQDVVNKQKNIQAYAFARLAIQHNNVNCPAVTSQLMIDHHTDGSYVVMAVMW